MTRISLSEMLHLTLEKRDRAFPTVIGVQLPAISCSNRYGHIGAEKQAKKSHSLPVTHAALRLKRTAKKASRMDREGRK